ncbi:MAG TPA: long-chain fatty acid--CoA ligase [Candidatus Polarisedimenticolia bacterium]|jgi:long-chain acyl-CoA synthetase|nr:long-chain fatty acid--CoA ligase [Candidatus Polarisedimenticolia bacterium]
MEIRTLADIFFASIAHDVERHVMFKRGSEWQVISSRQLYGYVATLARALKQWGIHKGDRVAILGENRPEWMIADFACVNSGIVDVPIYATLTADQTLYLLQNSRARVVFVSTLEQLRKVQSIKAQTSLEKIVVMDDVSEVNVIPMWSVINGASLDHDPQFDEEAHKIQADDLATLIYTSGTTGTSKGVMLSHGNLTACAIMASKQAEWTPDDVYLSFLPLSHVTARHVDYVCYLDGVSLAYCAVFDQLPQMLQEARPTIIVAVPRVYEKIRGEAERRAGHGLKRKIFDWAVRVGEKHKEEIALGKTPTDPLWKIANQLVFSKIRQGFGGRSRAYFSGGAPLGKDMAEWFCAVGIPIMEGYGLTETSPTLSVNRRGAFKIGSVGKVNEGLELKIAEDGEILVKGPTVFKGYWEMPEETRNAFVDGWFKTGDIGELDSAGFLSITDRKKDLIKTSGGKFIAPQPIENALKANVLVAQAAIIGDKRKYASVIISPHFPLLEDWARANGVSFTSRQELVGSDKVRELYRGIVEDLNKRLAQFETIKKIVVVPDEFTVATGEITPTLKLKRRVIEAKYKQQIDELYQQPHPIETAPVG